MSDGSRNVASGQESAAAAASRRPKTSKSRLAVRAALLVAAVVVVVLFGRRFASYLPEFTAWVDGLGVWGPIAFVFGYAVAAVAFIPGSLLTLAGGAIFGLWKGTLLVFIGATLGSIGLEVAPPWPAPPSPRLRPGAGGSRGRCRLGHALPVLERFAAATGGGSE